MNNLKEHINSIILNYQDKTRSLSRDIKAINDDHANYQRQIKEQIKVNVIDDMISMSLIIAFLNVITVIAFKAPGLVSCLLIDTLLITCAPVIDTAVRYGKSFALIKKDRLRVKNETELVKDVLDKYYKKIVELNKLCKRAEHMENTAELYSQVECIKETIIDDYVPQTSAPEVEKVQTISIDKIQTLSLDKIFKKQ